jgi:hypothetical protein
MVYSARADSFMSLWWYFLNGLKFTQRNSLLGINQLDYSVSRDSIILKLVKIEMQDKKACIINWKE